MFSAFWMMIMIIAMIIACDDYDCVDDFWGQQLLTSS